MSPWPGSTVSSRGSGAAAGSAAGAAGAKGQDRSRRNHRNRQDNQRNIHENLTLPAAQSPYLPAHDRTPHSNRPRSASPSRLDRCREGGLAKSAP